MANSAPSVAQTMPSAAALSVVHSNAAILGDIAWLMLGLEGRRGWRVGEFSRMVMPAIARRQFRLYYDGTIPIAYVSWALLSAEAEARFIADPFSLRPEDWTSGESACIVDFVAIPGTLWKIARFIRRDPLISQRPVTAIRTRRGLRKVTRVASRRDGRARVTIERLDRPV